MAKGVTAVPTYLITVAIMLVVGVIAASALTGMFLPLAVQKAYMGNAIKYSYTITQGRVVVTLANAKDYDAKADVLLITKDGKVSTTCVGYVYSSMNLRKAPPQAKAISLLGITVRPHEIVKIACLNTSVRTVRVVEYGLPAHKQSEAYIGAVGEAGYSIKSGSFTIGSPYQPADLRYRIPVTVVATKDYGNAYVNLVISPSTVPYDIFRFVMGHVRSDANDVLVVGADGTRYPTKATRTYYSLIVTFKVGQLRKGVYRYWLWFGNPDLKKPPYPLKKLEGTPIYTCLPYVAKTSFAYPAYVVPEANWLPFYSPYTRYGLIYTESYDTFKKYVTLFTTTKNNYNKVRQAIAEALSNMTYFPIGTASTDWHYRDLTPKTAYGDAPWATVTVVPLPSFTQYGVAEGTTVTTKIWVASDDGSGAYFINLREGSVVKVEYYDQVYVPHYPRYWNYVVQKRFSASEVAGSNYLVVLQQNGICGCSYWGCRCGNGPGWLDFRYVKWFVQSLSKSSPSQGSGGGSGGSGGSAGRVYDFEHDVVKCSKISSWAMKCAIAPSNFVYLTYRTSGGIYGADVTAQKAYSGRKSLHATIGDDRSGYYKKFPAVILFPGPLPKKITFYYYCEGEFRKASGGAYLQGFDGRKWVNIAKLEVAGTWLEVTVQNANRYQKIRIYMYVDTSLTGQARLDLYIDHVVYSG